MRIGVDNAGAGALLALAVTLTQGCATPLGDTSAEDLRRAILDSTRRSIEEAGGSTGPLDLGRETATLPFPEERLEELDALSGVNFYAAPPLELGADLTGAPTRTVAFTLERAVITGVANNLDTQLARITPAISAAQLLAAQAAFDWTLFASFNFSDTEEESAVPVISGVPIGSQINANQTFAYDVGLRRRLETGGDISFSQGINTFNNQSTGLSRVPDPARTADVTLALTQPLLRSFGVDVNRAEIDLTRNAEASAVEALRARLIATVSDIERAYWGLVLAQRTLQISNQLLLRGIETRDVLQGRLGFDVRPAEYSDAVARVETRKGDVIRAENLLRQSSDNLKAILNDPELQLGDETLLLPSDSPVDTPVAFGLLESITTALDRKPEVQQAILAIDDASIRRLVAENARLPLLDFDFQTRFVGLGGNGGESVDQLLTGDFVDYLVGLTFEQPIGNRAAEAQARSARLDRLAAVVGYRNVVQAVLLELKTSMRDVAASYKLIEQTRAARLAAAENLRTLLVEEQNIRALTPDFLNLKLNRQEALAQAEIQETQALIDYNTALARYHTAIGTILERRGVRFTPPTQEDYDALLPAQRP